MPEPVDPRDLQLSSYDYPLPQERIAQAPVEPRHQARLLLVPPVDAALAQARHGQVWDLQQELQPLGLPTPVRNRRTFPRREPH